MITLSAGIGTRLLSKTFWLASIRFGLVIIQTSTYLDDIHRSTDIKWGKPDQTKHTKTVLGADHLFPSAKHTACAGVTQSTCSYSNVQIHS